jgi:hypothetical protein
LVQPQKRALTEPRVSRPVAGHGVLRIAEACGELPVGGRTGVGIEVSAQHDGAVALGMAQPIGTEQCRDLHVAFGTAESQVGREQLQGECLGRDDDPDDASRLPPRRAVENGEQAGRAQPERHSAQYRVPVAFASGDHGGLKDVVHRQLVGEPGRLIHKARLRAADIDFLQRDDIGVAGGDDSSDARRGESTVHADAAVNVVGHDSQRDTFFAWRGRRGSLPAYRPTGLGRLRVAP